MPISLPNLDDTTYAQLLETALRRIPVHAPDWTNHNESDPGITLVQLLAYFTEMLLFQINQITDRDRAAFAKLLGAEHLEGADADEELRQAILRRRIEQRAVTPADFERHAMEADKGVARARCLARRNVEEANQAARRADRPGHVSVLVVTHPDADSGGVLARVRTYLEARRLLTVRVHVAPARFVKVRARFRIFLLQGASAEGARRDAADVLHQFLHPLAGGPQHKGWPFGRSIFVSELYQILAKLPVVDYVTSQIGSGTTVRVDEIEAPGDASRATRNEEGELTALKLSDEELPAITEIDLEVVAR
jgi:hypothetical protein